MIKYSEYLPVWEHEMSQQFDLDLFENDAKQNGRLYWIAHDFMRSLGYTSWQSFSQIINKAIASCASSDISINDNFEQISIDFEGKKTSSFKLSRFACFLITIHADSKKEQVSQAKVLLAAMADRLVEAALDSGDIERLEMRSRLKEGEGIMIAVAKWAGLETSDFGIFKDAGFRGMYNMSLAELRSYKGLKTVGSKSPVLYDFMGHTELAGNYFRVTQTAERIRSDNAKGKKQLTTTAKDVGREVREMMIRNSGVAPEELKLEQNIKEVKKTLKGASRDMIKHDKTKK